MATAISGALAIVPMALSNGTAHADSANWDAIAQCESGGNWATNTGRRLRRPAVQAGHLGLQRRWRSPATAPRAEQIRVAENVLRTQGIKAWPKCGPRGDPRAVEQHRDAGRALTADHDWMRRDAHQWVARLINPRQMCTALLNPLSP